MLLTQGAVLQCECDNAEQVDVGVVDSELHKHCSGQGVQPAVVKEVLEDSAEEEGAWVSLFSGCSLPMNPWMTLGFTA